MTTTADSVGGQIPGASQTRKPTILLFGDSHSYAVQRAIEKRQGKGYSVPLTAFRLLKIKNGVELGNLSFEDFCARAALLEPDDVVLSAVGGNQHAVFSTVQHPQKFDFLQLGDRPRRDAQAELIPYRVLAGFFESGIRNRDGQALKALREATKARVVHIIPPPPKADNEFIERYHEAVFAQEGITASGVSHPHLRQKFWQLQARLLERLCAELGIEVMYPPAAAVDVKGFLSKPYYANDATHANHHYGELLLREVEQRFLSDLTSDRIAS